MRAHVAARVHRISHPYQNDPRAADLDEPGLAGDQLVERGDPDGLPQC
jgi:hypothetical protein